MTLRTMSSRRASVRFPSLIASIRCGPKYVSPVEMELWFTYPGISISNPAFAAL